MDQVLPSYPSFTGLQLSVWAWFCLLSTDHSSQWEQEEGGVRGAAWVDKRLRGPLTTSRKPGRGACEPCDENAWEVPGTVLNVRALESSRPVLKSCLSLSTLWHIDKNRYHLLPIFYWPGICWALNMLYLIYNTLSFLIVPTLQMKKLSCREVKQFVQGHQTF